MLTTLILSGDSSTTPDAAPTTTGPTAEEQCISDFCIECVSMVSDVIEKKQEALFETLGDDGAQLQKIMDTKTAATSV